VEFLELLECNLMRSLDAENLVVSGSRSIVLVGVPPDLRNLQQLADLLAGSASASERCIFT